jgi:glycosyltransferase involved in cell wall biosynthesis
MNLKLSVCVITYNHEKYLAQCLDSIISQQCDSPFEIVIGEDKSTDSTALIVEQYRFKHPELITVISAPTNVGMVQNWRRTINAARGEYIAIIEGDDFWTDNTKLAKQIAFLDKRKSYALCFHDVKVISNNNTKEIDFAARHNSNESFTIKDIILRDWFIPTCSIVIRKSMLEDFPDWTKNLKAIDIVVQLLAATKGEIGYIAETLGAYRIHESGISQLQWAGRQNIFEFTIIDIFSRFNTYTHGMYYPYIKQRIERSCRLLLSKNSPWSKHYFNAMFKLIKLEPGKNIFLIKDWLILNLIPTSLYKLYRHIK